MFFIYASMIEFIIVNYLHRKMHQSNRPNTSDQGNDPGRSTFGNQISVGRNVYYTYTYIWPSK